MPGPSRTGDEADPPLVVRAATESDVDVLVAMRLALFREEARGPRARGRAAVADLEQAAWHMTTRQLRATDAPVFVAAAGERVVGTVRCTLVAASPLSAARHVASITAAYVVPEWRRRGVMRRLVDEAAAWSRAQGASELQLRCGLDNDVGNAAWNALGFEAMAVVRRRSLPG